MSDEKPGEHTKKLMIEQGQWLSYWFLYCVAMCLRMWAVVEKPLHHDESLHAYFGYQIFKSGEYAYTPFLHGPVLYYLIALFQKLFGDSLFALYAVPAFFGSLIVFLPYFLRHRLGQKGALAAAVLIAISPTYLYFSRFLRHDILAELFHGLTLVGIWFFIITGKRRHLFLAAAAIALNYANHELTYITVFLMAIYLLLYVRGKRVEKEVLPWIHKNRVTLLWCLTIFLVIYTTLFSSFFTHFQGLLDGLPNPFSKTTSLGYWLAQHEVNRGDQPIYYYLILLCSYEFLALFGFIGIVVDFDRHRKDPVKHFLVFWALGSFLVYSWAGERMPWLLLHILTPMILLTGALFENWWFRRKSIRLAFFALFFIATVLVSVRLNYFRAADPREMLVYVQTSPDVRRFVDRAKRYEKSIKRPVRYLIDQEINWPLAWHFREEPSVAYVKDLRDNFEPDMVSSDFILIPTKNLHDVPVFEDPFDFFGCYRLRSWWVPKKEDFLSLSGPRNIWNWLLYRETPNPVGSLIFCAYQNRVNARAPKITQLTHVAP